MSTQSTIELHVNKPYNFAASVCSHGWPQLAPNVWDAQTATLRRVERLDNGNVILLHIRGIDRRDGVRLEIDIDADGALTTAEYAEARAKVRWMLKLDEDLTDFYRVARSHAGVWSNVEGGGGRLLRSPTLWEDVVKMIATTNVSWVNTVSMVGRLVTQLGDPLPHRPELGRNPALRAFPTPEQVAQADDAIFTNTIRMGYRNAYVQQLAREIVDETRDIETLRTRDRASGELKKAITSIKGVGDYAANSLMMLLGHYDGLPMDSAFRSRVGKRYFDGQPTSAQEMAVIYESWGAWKALAYWFDAFE